MSASEWEFGVAVEPEDIEAPRCEDDSPRVEARWLDEDDRDILELGTDEPDEWMTSDEPVWSLSQWT